MSVISLPYVPMVPAKNAQVMDTLLRNGQVGTWTRSAIHRNLYGLGDRPVALGFIGGIMSRSVRIKLSKGTILDCGPEVVVVHRPDDITICTPNARDFRIPTPLGGDIPRIDPVTYHPISNATAIRRAKKRGRIKNLGYALWKSCATRAHLCKRRIQLRIQLRHS